MYLQTRDTVTKTFGPRTRTDLKPNVQGKVYVFRPHGTSETITRRIGRFDGFLNCVDYVDHNHCQIQYAR